MLPSLWEVPERTAARHVLSDAPATHRKDRPMTIDREAILREWRATIPENVAPTRDEVLDLISRAVDAAYEDAARAVEGESLHDNTGDPFDLAYMEAITDTAAAIRALIGGGE